MRTQRAFEPLAGNVNAQQFYLSRQAGWKETQVIEDKTAHLDRMSAEDLAKAIEERANKLGIKIKLSID